MGLLLSISAALLGVNLVLKRFSMLGDGLSHVSFGAAAVGLACGVAPLQFSIPIVIVAAFLLLRLKKNSKISKRRQFRLEIFLIFNAYKILISIKFFK